MEKLDIEKVELFATVRHEVGQLFDAYLTKVNDHFEWLDEKVEEARKMFESDFSLSIVEEKSRPQLRGVMKKRHSGGKKLSPSAGKRVSRQGAIRRSAVMAYFRDIDDEEDSSETEDDEDKSPVPVIVGDSKMDNAGIAQGNVDPKKLTVVPVVEENIKDNGGLQKADGDVRKTQNKAELDAKIRLRTAVEKQKFNGAQNSVLPATKDSLASATGAIGAKASEKGPMRVHLPITKPKSTAPLATPHNTVKVDTPWKRSMALDGGLMEGAVVEQFNKRQEAAASKRDEFLKLRIDSTRKKREEQLAKVVRKRMAQMARDETVRRNAAENDQADSGEAVLRPRFRDGTSNPNNPNGGVAMDKKALEKQRIKREQNEMRRLEALEGKRQWERSAPDAPELVGKKNNAEAGQAEPSTKPKYKAIFAIPVDKKIAEVVPSPRPNRNTIVITKPKVVKPNPGGACAASSDFRPAEIGSNDDNYDITDVCSSDDTDDEEHPRKKIPAWARGGQLQMRLTQNFYNPPDLDDLFGVLCMPGDMTQMFDVHRECFFKRTSSDEWDSPVRPHTNDPKK